uniref:Uncharacterized protein n=1 Tax=viral metagenome TaxID=1070528 RepID=A0A6M3ME00_9ZZZZ
MEGFRESVGLAFGRQDRLNRSMMLSIIDTEFVKGLRDIEDLKEVRALINDVVLEIGDTKAEDLRKLYINKLKTKLPDIQKTILDRLLMEI